MNKKLIRKMQTAAGGPIKKFRTRDINGNWVYMDMKTGRTTSADPESGTIRNNAVNSVGGDNKTKRGRTQIAKNQVTSYNNRLYKVHNYADTTMRLKQKNQDVILDKQGEPEVIQADYTPTLEAPMEIVSPEFDLLTLGRLAITSAYNTAKPTNVVSETYYHGSPILGLTTLEPQNGVLWLTNSKSGARLYGGGITGRGSLYKVNNVDLGNNILTVNGKFHSPFKIPLKDLPENVLKYLPEGKHTYIDNVARAAELAGYSSVLFRNVLDFGGKGFSLNPFHSYMYKQTAVFNPTAVASESVSPISKMSKILYNNGGKIVLKSIFHNFKNGGRIRKMQTASGGPLFPWLLNTEWVDNWKFRTTPASRSRVLSGKGVETDKQYTERRKRETTKRTWRSDAADVAHGIGEGVLALNPYTAIPYFGAKVGQDILNGNVGWQTAVNASIPLFHLSPQAIGLNEVSNIAKPLTNKINWLYNDGNIFNAPMRYNPNNYYREVSKEAIDDAINSGVVRSGNTKRYIGPFFGKGYTPWQREKYIIEGYPENNDWIYANPYENAVYVMQDEPELGKALMQDAFKKIPKNSNVGAEAFPYRNGSINSTPTTNFDYWKKYPLLGWRKNNFKQGGKMNIIEFLKNGSGIHIKEKNKGKFTSYCGGKVTDECIRKAKASDNPTLVKRATFAANARKWKHKEGGKAFVTGVNILDSNPKAYKYVKKKYKMALLGTKLNFFLKAGNWLNNNGDLVKSVANAGLGILSSILLNKAIDSQIEANKKLMEANKQKVFMENYKKALGLQTDRSDIINMNRAWLIANNLDYSDNEELMAENALLEDSRNNGLLDSLGGLASSILNSSNLFKKSTNSSSLNNITGVGNSTYNWKTNTFNNKNKVGTINSNGSMNTGIGGTTYNWKTNTFGSNNIMNGFDKIKF